MIVTGTPASIRTMPGWLPGIATQLAALRAMQEDWDGYGAAATKPDVIDAAEKFLESSSLFHQLAEPTLVPSRIGGLMFVWKAGAQELELELISADEAEYLFSDRTNGTELEGQFALRSGIPPDLSNILVQFSRESL